MEVTSIRRVLIFNLDAKEGTEITSAPAMGELKKLTDFMLYIDPNVDMWGRPKDFFYWKWHSPLNRV